MLHISLLCYYLNTSTFVLLLTYNIWYLYHYLYPVQLIMNNTTVCVNYFSVQSVLQTDDSVEELMLRCDDDLLVENHIWCEYVEFIICYMPTSQIPPHVDISTLMHTRDKNTKMLLHFDLLCCSYFFLIMTHTWTRNCQLYEYISGV